MTIFRIIIRSLVFYRRKHSAFAAGVAVSMAVLTGALMVGDTMSWNLQKMVDLRLGSITHSVTCSDRYFTDSLAAELEAATGYRTAPVLQLQGMILGNSGAQISAVSITGIDSAFINVTGTGGRWQVPGDREMVISRNIAERLDVHPGDEVLLRIRKASLVPMNAPFVADDGGAVAARMRISAIADDETMARYTLRVTQTPPLNVFISLAWLNRLMETDAKANALLLDTDGRGTAEQISSALRKVWTYGDAQLILKKIETTGELSLRSERVFLDPAISRAAESLPYHARPVLTYFVNSISFGERSTPYSFVSSTSDDELGEDETVINEWLAKDLEIRVGDSLTMSYYIVGPLRELQEESRRFVVRKVVGMEGAYADPSLMPDIPGLSDAGNCRDWETGIPIDLSAIRDKDEAYWNAFHGTPKAFIRTDVARALWENRFGSYTEIRFCGEHTDMNVLEDTLMASVDPASLGIAVQDVKTRGQKAAGEGVDFSQLFIGLSFFVLLAAVILTILLLHLNLDGRREQVRTLSGLGIPRRKIRMILLREQLAVSLPGLLLGAILAVLYNGFVFRLLNSLWSDIVRTELIRPVVLPSTLITGGLITLLIIWVAVYLALKRFLEPQERGVFMKKTIMKRGVNLISFWLLVMLPGLLGLALIVWQLFRKESENPSMFFLAGGLLLLSFLSLMMLIFARGQALTGRSLNIRKLALTNSLRNSGRSLGIIALFALGSFLVISTGSNRKDLFSGSKEPGSGTGGYRWFAQSSVPVLKNLNDPEVKMEMSLDTSLHFVQFSRAEGDDASCLNLNRISQPAILGVDPAMLKGRFSFVSSVPLLDPADPWAILKDTLASGLVPAIADETVIKWGLGLKAGDTLHYTGSRGESMDLLLVGGLAGSVFQGNILIGSGPFLDYFPDHSGSTVFLIKADSPDPESQAGQLRSVMRDYGWDMEEAAARLAAFYSVTNTYLAIFLAMGALALMLGTIGLAIILIRTLQERKSELALLGAMGYRKRNILRLILTEFIWLELSGILIGSLTAIVATLPSLLSPNTGISLTATAQIVVLLVLNGVFWIVLFSVFAVGKEVKSSTLRNE